LSERRAPVERSWLEVQWRKLRNPPPPVFRAIAANLTVAVIGGVVLLVIGRLNPTADITPWVVLYVAVIVLAGSVLTYLWVELPTGLSGVRRRSGWAGLLGFFAAIPIAYLSLVVIFQVIKPLLG
jgi:hypothetical protein